jgi:hypothetical protein
VILCRNGLFAFALVIAIFLLSPCLPAQATERTAVAAHVADVVTTGAGLSLGAAEANPLGLALLGVKLATYQHIKAQPAEEQPRLWGVFGAFGWAAAANNLCVIASGGACLAVGALAGLLQWRNAEPERLQAKFAAVCERERLKNPALQCVWMPAHP